MFSQNSQKISLPTYPFARERYWISETQGKTNIVTSGTHDSAIHPLLHENTSYLSEQRFTSTFTGKEFFLAGHIIKGQRVFPGVCYLEMARVAVEKASEQAGKGMAIYLRNIVWVQPVVVNRSGKEVHIGLLGEEKGQIQYEVYTESENGKESIVHFQGIAEFKLKQDTQALDIPGLKSQMNLGVLNAESCYQVYNEMGAEGNERFGGLQQIYQGENQVLAKLCLPYSNQNTRGEYVLEPCLMNAAISSLIGLNSINGTLLDKGEVPLEIALPFELESLEILASCTFEMYAWVRRSGSGTQLDKVQKFDIDLCDEQGSVCVKMRGYTTRVLDGEVEVLEAKDPIGTLLATPVWKETVNLLSAARQSYAEHEIILCEMPGINARELQSLIPGSHCDSLKSNQEQIESRFTNYAVHSFEIIRKIIENKLPGKILVQIIVPSTQEQSLFIGLLGLLKTAALENPKIVGQIIQVDPQEKREELANKVQENRNTPHDVIIRYEGEKRSVLAWEEFKETEVKPRVTLNDQGVYLITGGLGGLGGIFTRELLREAKDAKIVLTGRSELSAQKQSVFDELQALGGSVEYQKIDVSDPEQVNSLIEIILNRYGKLDGIIHSAGVISDNFILKKRAEEFRQVLLPKVAGTVNLDMATHGIALDFFVLFSSGAGATGNLGQADYATANAFMDWFAVYRNQLVHSRERQGQTLSINWPLWREGGMGVDQASEDMMKQSTGMIAMQTETGIRAFYQSLNSNHSQVLAMEGLVSKMRKTLFSHPDPQKTSSVSQAVTGASFDTSSLVIRLENALIQRVSKMLKLNPQNIDREGEL
ncbi:MAG: SDR family NAD(P)-dependent oxidoreductase, partial [Proteobacteria bacterium]|nr:SDR family NAD(P)-dependent oxidoreductase [Pseudomonadota bacterium]